MLYSTSSAPILMKSSISLLNLVKLTSFSSSAPKFILPIKQISTISSFSTSSSSSLVLTLSGSTRRRVRVFSTATAAAEDGTFFAEKNVSWVSLGISDRLSQALCSIGLDRPSLVQAACIPFIKSKNDVVVAAETGSGKTHGYLVPLIDKLCTALENSNEDTPVEGQLTQLHSHSLVLCPNVMLCEQVVRMANCICKDSGEPLLRAAAVCGRQGWPAEEPDIVVSTPAALLNYLYAIDPDRRRRSNFMRGVKYVVFDEADMLLCGSFQNQVIRLINMFRFDEKLLSREKSSEAERLLDSNSDFITQFEEEESENLNPDSILKEEEAEIVQVVQNKGEENEVGVVKRRDWRRVRKTYERSKQYIFVAATLPENGKRTAGGVLKKMFPDASWVSGSYLHCHSPRLVQNWVEVTVDTQVDILIEAVNQGSNTGNEVSRTMVFANTVEAVEAVANILSGAGIHCFRYHRDGSLEERAQNLVDFQQKGGVFVCTDAAARGLDVQNVSHVIQAEFASSAVDFIHRVGRTARAGQPGLVTSLYTESNKDLVAAVRQAGKLGQPVEKAFSRKRSFRNKIKKRALSSKDSATSSGRERIQV
ncbi:DEAD-box ATP-dependent RNA helicase 22 [Daucus carota subsp. sativus]|uniref:DEAD-box ATP-dependent RNA helicase 22 n=1 Tax=Daucus carota subsp. sativus TaxID=79200 RepID=UPI0007EEF653|nr:PREDICTED: DEAD-box ATP-dependent RNA helicase 22 [Daucus carota subsp. sativus]